MMARSTTLQSEAGYIDARPLTANSTKTLATHGRTIHWVNRDRLKPARSRPLFTQEPTFRCTAANVAVGQCTKSLRSSPLRGGGSREAANPIDRTAITVWRGQHDQQAYCKMIR